MNLLHVFRMVNLVSSSPNDNAGQHWGWHGLWVPDDELRLNRQARLQVLDRRDRHYGLRWIWASNGQVPASAVRTTGPSGSRTYIGRAHFQGSVTPGMIVPERKACCIAWGGNEHAIRIYEVLCSAGNFVQITPTDADPLLRATSGGISESGEPVFIGRAKYKGNWLAGKVQRSHGSLGMCYIPYGGKEVGCSEYQVFVAVPPQPRTISHYWRPSQGSNIPADATVGGANEHGPLYIGHASHRGSCTPGQISQATKRCHIAWGGSEHRKTVFEFLCNCRGRFVPSQEGQVPVGAVLGGWSEYEGEPLFVGRVKVQGCWLVGKVQPSHKVCYIPTNGKEVAHKHYEIFVHEGY